jgi:uncharacterized protein (TIRG00374 family)
VYLGVTGVSIYLVIPSVIRTFSSWPQLASMKPGSLLWMTAFTAASLGCFWILLGLCLRSRNWGLMATSQLTSAAIARVVPGGSATATAVQYKLLNQAGISSEQAGTGLTVATILNLGVLAALPVFSLPAILFGPPIDSALVNGAVAAGISFVAASLIAGLFLGWDRPLRALGRSVDAIATRVGRPPAHEPRAERYVSSRNLIRSHLGKSWHWVVLASLGKWGFDYMALVLAVRGVGHEDTSMVLLLAFVAASLLGKIPLTPGGLGFVEAGLTGTLVLAGLSSGDAVLATLAYRLVSYWLPIPLGGLAYLVYRRRMRARGVEVGDLSDVEAVAEAEHLTMADVVEPSTGVEPVEPGR